jgi:NhaA family Na+:H+ antiporter
MAVVFPAPAGAIACWPTDLETSMNTHASGDGRPRAALFGHGSWSEALRIGDVLRRETVGGALLLAATVLAMVWANSPWASAYKAVRDTRLGPASLHLDLTVGQWAADGLLAIFFFVAGLELKREFVAGNLRDPRQAALPVAAAVGGMVVPALLFVLINHDTGGGALRGGAIPIATDIAFALAVWR